MSEINECDHVKIINDLAVLLDSFQDVTVSAVCLKGLIVISEQLLELKKSQGNNCHSDNYDFMMEDLSREALRLLCKNLKTYLE